CVQGTHWPYIS
nr:immunoglobulin light chain junction region [Macaca mulatta]MOW65926.1 immunoglobulin light chain junction region [Macaca mulatta]